VAPASYAPSTARDRTKHAVAVLRDDGSAVCERCVLADRMLPRMKGLLGRRELPPGEGMLIKPAPSIHTFFMRFPLDAVFLSRSGEVLKVSSNVKPWRARSCRRAYSVLELAAGEAERRDIAPGQRLRLSGKER
jgi:uncharacterized membrane protein (UPF0127 family)